MPTVSVTSSDNTVRLAEGVALTVRGVVLVQNRGRLGWLSPGLDMLAPFPANESEVVVILQDNVLVHPMCLPQALQLATMANVSRPAAFSGRQEMGPPRPPPQPPGCSTSSSAPLLQRCWPQQGLYVDVAMQGQDPDERGLLTRTNVFLHLLNTQYVCSAVMQQECVKELGPTACFLYLSRMPRSAPGPPRSAASGASAGLPQGGGPPAPSSWRPPGPPTPLLVVLLPCVVGGALLAVVVTLVVALVVRRRAGPAGRYVADSGKLSPAPGGSGKEGPLPLGKADSTEAGPVPSLEGFDDPALHPPPQQDQRGSRPAGGPRPGAEAAKEAGDKGAGSELLKDASSGTLDVGGDMLALAAVAVCSGCLPAPEMPVPVTPFTPPRSDLVMDVVCDCGGGGGGGQGNHTEVKLLPVVLGQGNFGRVVEGLYGGQRVAVKLVPDLSQWVGAGGGAALHNYVCEVEVLARCSHPNIVRLLAACVTPPRLCLVMELMEMSLDRLIHSRPHEPEDTAAAAGGGKGELRGSGGSGGRGRPAAAGAPAAPLGPPPLLPLDKVLHVGIEVARGLEYLHPTVVHRDLKPGNVLLNNPHGPRPAVKLTDFGLSRLRSSVLVTRHPEAGTPPYMAPELYDITNNVVTDKSDIYSLGVLLWEMLTGLVPWQGCDPLVVAYAVTINRDRLPLGAVPACRLPPKLRRLLERLWDHDPLRRPAAAEVVRQLLLIQQDVARQQQQQQEGTAQAPQPPAAS